MVVVFLDKNIGLVLAVVLIYQITSQKLMYFVCIYLNKNHHRYMYNPVAQNQILSSSNWSNIISMQYNEHERKLSHFWPKTVASYYIATLHCTVPDRIQELSWLLNSRSNHISSLNIHACSMRKIMIWPGGDLVTQAPDFYRETFWDTL